MSKAQTDKQKAAFLAEFSQHGIVTPAAKAVGEDRSTVEQWRADDAQFAAHFDEAYEASYQLLLNTAVERGLMRFDEATGTYVETSKGRSISRRNDRIGQ